MRNLTPDELDRLPHFTCACGRKFYLGDPNNREVSPELRADLRERILGWIPGDALKADAIVESILPLLASVDANAHGRGRLEAVSTARIRWDGSRAGSTQAVIDWVNELGAEARYDPGDSSVGIPESIEITHRREGLHDDVVRVTYGEWAVYSPGHNLFGTQKGTS